MGSRLPWPSGPAGGTTTSRRAGPGSLPRLRTGRVGSRGGWLAPSPLRDVPNVGDVPLLGTEGIGPVLAAGGGADAAGVLSGGSSQDGLAGGFSQDGASGAGGPSSQAGPGGDAVAGSSQAGVSAGKPAVAAESPFSACSGVKRGARAAFTASSAALRPRSGPHSAAVAPVAGEGIEGGGAA